MGNTKRVARTKYKKRQVESVRYFDYGLLMVTILLIAFGLLMLYSSSSYDASLEYGDPARYLKRQLFAVAIGFVGLLFFTFVDYRLVEKCATVFYFGSFILSVLVIFIGTAQGTSSRWIYIGGISVQPSELCKVAVIVFIAAMIHKYRDLTADWRFIAKLFCFVLPPFLSVGFNNLSTAIIIFGIAYMMLLVAGKQYWLFVLIAALGVIMMFFYITLYGYRSYRFTIWRDPTVQGDGGQVMQGLYAIGSGGFFGKGLGESIQKQGFIPEAQNDMIFSIICEELGIVGAICVIVMYLLLLWRLMIIATNARDLFGSFVVIGIIAHISIQVILNIAVVTNTIPNTGVTLPFISYGGTSVSILVAEIGLALGVSRGIYLK